MNKKSPRVNDPGDIKPVLDKVKIQAKNLLKR